MNPTPVTAVEGDCLTIETKVIALNSASGSDGSAGE